MKIIYLHQYFNTPQMSGGTRSYEFARRLVMAGHEVHLVTSDRNPAPDRSGWRHERVDGINVHWYGVEYSNRFGFLRRVTAFLRFSVAALFYVRRLSADLVFATSTPLTIAIPGVYASRHHKIPLVFEVRDLWPESPIAVGAIRNPLVKWLAHRLERFAYANSTRVVALSDGMARGVQRTGVASDNIVVVPNICDNDRFGRPDIDLSEIFATYPFLSDRRIVLYAGALGRMNGLAYMIDIASEMASIDMSIGFLIIGDGGEREQIENRARALRVLGSNLWMLQRVPKEEIAAFFRAASAGTSFVIDIPETWNNSANKFFDTLAAGKPVIINYEGWQADEIRGHRAGLVIPPHDPPTAARMIAEFLNDESRVSESGQSSRELAHTKYDVETLFRRFLETIESTIPARPGDARSGRHDN